mgnify:FL=1|jgi:hypothetical protein
MRGQHIHLATRIVNLSTVHNHEGATVYTAKGCVAVPGGPAAVRVARLRWSTSTFIAPLTQDIYAGDAR